jgi:hypothetical protein
MEICHRVSTGVCLCVALATPAVSVAQSSPAWPAARIRPKESFLDSMTSISWWATGGFITES